MSCKASITVGVCYKSQSVDEQEIRNMFSAIGQATKTRCLIVGDFNYPNINWETLESNQVDGCDVPRLDVIGYC